MKRKNILLPKISVIIPAFNDGKYIKRCLLSVFNQTLREIEIIMVDDGSLDETLKIAETFNDSRLLLLNTTHCGVSNARNVGLRKARGEYIQFVDADDELRPDCCEIAYKLAKTKNSDVVFFGTSLISERNIPRWMVECTTIKPYYFPKFKPEVLFKITGTKPFVWNQIIRRKLLTKHNIIFDKELSLGEDQAFQFNFLPYANRIILTNTILYLHYLNEKSAVSEHYKSGKNKLLEHIKLVDTIFKSYKNKSFRMRYYVYCWGVKFLYPDFKSFPEMFDRIARTISLNNLNIDEHLVDDVTLSILQEFNIVNKEDSKRPLVKKLIRKIIIRHK